MPDNIENGFELMMRMAWPTAPEFQRKELRMAFFAGCNFLFGQLINNTSRTEDEDIKYIFDLEKELSVFIQKYQLENLPTAGRA